MNMLDCKTICWNAVSSVPNLAAFLCTGEDLNIVEFTKKSCSIWGMASLHDACFLSLVKCPQRVRMLQSGIRMLHRNGCEPDFAVKDMGCMEMISFKSSDGFDSYIKVISLPGSSSCESTSAVLIIIEPLVKLGISSGG